mmetsp:Transcript_19564/g.45484  ORF Transcript_19564/g.45484 Transcript_19564/m.45484 type:complete len:113 (+) Transcript_19564:1531-1869(+)
MLFWRITRWMFWLGKFILSLENERNISNPVMFPKTQNDQKPTRYLIVDTLSPSNKNDNNSNNTDSEGDTDRHEMTPRSVACNLSNEYYYKYLDVAFVHHVLFLQYRWLVRGN